MYDTIVVGFDGSDLSKKALQTAIGLSKLTKGVVHVVYSPQPQTVAYAMGAVSGYHAVTTMPSQSELATANRKVVDAAEALAGQEGVELAACKVMVGEPGDEIVRYADLYDADLIVTGRRGLGALGSIMQGSTSLRVNHLAKCASLSVI